MREINFREREPGLFVAFSPDCRRLKQGQRQVSQNATGCRGRRRFWRQRQKV